MIKTVKVESLVKYAKNCILTARTLNKESTTRENLVIRAEAIRAFLAMEDANRKYKLGTGKDEEWSKYFDEVWEEYNDMIFG